MLTVSINAPRDIAGSTINSSYQSEVFWSTPLEVFNHFIVTRSPNQKVSSSLDLWNKNGLAELLTGSIPTRIPRSSWY